MAILSIDFGGTRTRAAWFSDELDMLARDEAPTPIGLPPAVVARVIEIARRVVPPGQKPAAVGVCAPGPQAGTGLILHAPTLPGWDRVPLAQMVAEAFDTPVFMENDANLAALAEYHLGAARGANPALYLTVSTGIGGGAIINGALFTGWRGLAIEPGHIKFPLPDGRIRSLEDLASGTAIGRRAKERLAEGDQPSALRNCDVVDGRTVGLAAAQGDALALEVVAEAGRWLGLGLVCLMHLFNPQTIVIGGSVASLGDLIFDPARQMIAAYLTDPAFNDPDLIHTARLGDDVCLIGAAFYARARSEI
ncbi:MAG: ROK family protein [Chloroflexi bacterium]|nr:ROK family protein [Chloroflexota bacterium]MDL1882437.1 ROK family protein [Anaerolineae bacterium CFX8]